MKRWIIVGLMFAALLLSPSRGTEVSELLPVELLYICESEGQILVRTDTGHAGAGDTLETALADLKAVAPGRVFLETADYLIVTEETQHLLPQLWEILRPATEVCLGIGADADAAEFLSVHKPNVTLNDLRGGNDRLPILIQTEGRYHLAASTQE